MRWVAQHAADGSDSVRDVHEQHALCFRRIVWDVGVHFRQCGNEVLATAIDANRAGRKYRVSAGVVRLHRVRANVQNTVPKYRDGLIRHHPLGIHRHEVHVLEVNPLLRLRQRRFTKQHRQSKQGRNQNSGGHNSLHADVTIRAMWRSLIFWLVLVAIGVAVWALSVRVQSPSSVAARFPDGELVDLSHAYGADTIFWPTANKFSLRKDADGVTPAGYYYASNSFSTSEHGGTHLDAPVHFAQGHQSVDQIPLQRFFGPAVVVDVTK